MTQVPKPQTAAGFEPVLSKAWPYIFLILCAVLVFSRAVGAEFVKWDDDINIYRNSHLGPLDWSHVRWIFTDDTYVMYYAPLSWLNVFLVYSMFGLNPVGYHLSCLVFHIANTLLVFWICRKCIAIHRNKGDESCDPVSIWASLAGALFWAIHPLRVEAVAWSTGISYCQSTFFLLIACKAYLHFATASERRPMWYAIAVLSYAVSLLTYPIGLTWPLALLVTEVLLLRRTQLPLVNWWRRQIVVFALRLLPFLLLSGGLLFLTFYRRAHAAGIWSAPVSLDEFGVLSRVMQAVYIWAHYLWMTLLPFHLSPVYTTLLDFDPLDLPFLMSGVIVLGLTGLLVWKKQRGILLCWLLHLILLLPFLGVAEHPHYPSDRYNYLAALPWSVLAAVAIRNLAEQKKRLLMVRFVPFILLVLIGWLSFQQIAHWKNSPTLFSYVVSELKDHIYRADIYQRLGMYYLEQKKPREAIEAFRQALKVSAGASNALAALVETLTSEGLFDEALWEIKAALVLNPHADDLFYRQGVILGIKGHLPEASGAYRECLRLNPSRAEALNNLAWIYATAPSQELRNGGEAVQFAEKACELTKRSIPVFIGTLAAAYAEAARFEDAEQAANEAIRVASSQGRQDLVEANKKLLAAYQKKQPYRQGL
jgi:tetratricopeptide (TPR) repeat protein